jgi:hypothetical protein
MSSAYIIETRKGAAGIVIRDGRGFRFFAARREFDSLDGHLFATPRAAEAAALDCLHGVRPKGPRTAPSTGSAPRTTAG